MPTDELAAVAVAAATPDDWALVRQLRLDALTDTPEAFCATLDVEARLPEDGWRGRLTRTDTTTLIARAGAAPVGLAVVEPTGDAEVAGLGSVWVAPAGRGRGVGDALVAAAVEEARRRGYHRLALEVGDDNAAAQALYARHGFAPTGRTSTMPPPKQHVTEHELARDL